MTLSVTYMLADPTGNITVLAETPVPPELRLPVAAQLTELEPETEQVGFLTFGEGPAVFLRMAGGEFCGNAAMSAAALCAERIALDRGRITVQVDGTPAPAPVEIAAAPGGWRAEVSMPLPLSVGEERFPGGGTYPVVRFAGISHVILAGEPDRAEAEAHAPVWCRYLGADALGLMFLGEAEKRLTPLVYVPAAGTLCWENSCASGTSAAGAYLARRSGQALTLALHQPGGTLTVSAAPDGPLTLAGTVKLRRRGTVSLEL